MAKTDKKPRVSVLERRLQNPFGEPSTPIALTDPALLCRWFNSAISSDKVWRAKHVKGWTTVTEDMLLDKDQVGGYQKSPDGYVTRGERGQEVLMCMPREDFDLIQMAKTRENNRNMGNPQAMKNEVVEAAGQRFGDEAADFLNRRSGAVGSITDSYERIERREVE